ncbi:low-density lipoprotein receptor-related protein 1-like isoform X2 [Apostichopus japonicus]|uniref:low-density lipoprotein receptor-related protein 1-like isoform X2 n=1 Tax=Stichopus japonicus TaxID=307972 RepID=UPI003AB70106
MMGGDSAGKMFARSWKELEKVFIVILLCCCYVASGQDCGGHLAAADSETEITFPGFGGPVVCEWTLRTTEINSYIRLNVKTLSLPESPGCERHRLEIWADGFVSDEDPEKFCGNGVGKWPYFLSTGQQMLVRFVSAGPHSGERFNFLLSFITEVEVDPRLVWTDKAPDSGRMRVHSLPADPNAYIFSGSITTKYYYQTDTDRFLAIANDRRERTLFWSDGGDNQIIRGSIGRHSTGQGIFAGVSNEVQGLAVDWVARNVYMTDVLYNWILLMKYDASIVLHVVTTGLDVPRGIAVHPMRSYLFWTDCGDHPRIERSNLYGGERIVLVDTLLTSPNGITVDFQSQRIFWTNAGVLANTVESSLFDGGDRETLFSLSSYGAQFFHLTTYQDYVFVTDLESHIRCARKSIPGEQYFALNLDAVPYGITVYDYESQPMSDSPCSSNPCSDLCVGMVAEPHFKCLCPDARLLSSDDRTCEPKTLIAFPAVFIARTTNLCDFPSNYPTMALPSNYQTSCFLSGRQHAVALAVDVQDNMLFFSDISAKKVSAVRLAVDSNVFDIAGVTQSVEGIAVDWISNNVYWTDNPAGKISVASYDGQHYIDLITTDILSPRAIAVEPFTRHLFWGEFGAPAQIERSDLDGSNRRVIVSEDIVLPNGIAIDYSEQRLYFGDSGTGTIEIIGYDGEDRVTLLARRAPMTHNYFGMTLFQDFILWTEFGQGNGIYVANRFTGEMVREHRIREEGVFGITMYAESRQPEGDGPCLVDNGGCSQLCLPSSTATEGRVCRCTFGFDLDDAGTTCISRVVEDNFVLFPDSFLKKVFQVDLTDPTYRASGLTLGTMMNPIGVSYDSQERMVYWSDVVDGSINRAGLDGSNREKVIDKDALIADGFTLDPIGRLLFWTDKSNRSISVSTLSGSRQTTLISDGLENPRAIALHTEAGYMYWTDWGSVAKIERSFMDGSGRETLFNTGLAWPNGLTIDKPGRKLYWGEAQLDRIECSDLDGRNRQLLIDFSISVHPYGIGIFGQYIFWADWAEASLMRADKGTGENIQSVGPPGLRRPNEIHIYSSASPDHGNVACLNNNGGCEGICLPSSGGRTCHCGDEGSLGQDGTSCPVEGEIEDLVECPLAFDQGEFEDGCAGKPGDVCIVSCPAGFTNRVASVTCMMSGEWDEDLSTVCEVIITEAPLNELTVHIYLTDVNPILGDVITVNCDVSDENTEITWYKDGTSLQDSPIDDAFDMGDTLLIVEYAYIHQGRYSCSAYREQDGAMADAVLEIFLPLDELFAQVPGDLTMLLFDNNVLPCEPRDRRHTVSWEKNGAPLRQDEHVHLVTPDVLVFRSVTLEESGVYTCVLTSGHHRIATVSAQVRIDNEDDIQEVCGTITAPEAIDMETSSTAEGRIVGGRKAIRGSAPWMVRLYDRGRRRHFCGGSLLNSFWVISAAHCIRGYLAQPQDLMIRLGDYDTKQTENSEHLEQVHGIYIPEMYNSSTYDGDIALIRLAHPITRFSEYVRPICLPNIATSRRAHKVGELGKVTGWGQIADYGPYPRYMTEVILPLVGKRRCRDSTRHLVTTNMFCAGYPRESGDACMGDSGGPYSVYHRGRWYILGIVSWGEGCGVDGKYGFYTKVAKFLEWTNAHINS